MSWYVGVLKGGLMGITGEGEGFGLHSHRLMSPLTPRRYFGFFCVFAREQLGAEKQINRAGQDFLLLLWREPQKEAIPLQQWCDFFFFFSPRWC